MIKLNARDIVKRALQLADLENSSFISWNENVQILNEGYQKIYQKAINHDDKTYMVKVPLSLASAYGQGELHYELPDDFYQLYSLTDSRTGKCVVRKTANDPVALLRYEIVNNELVVYGNDNLSLVLAYYPVPKTLSLKAEGVSFSVPDVTGMAFSDVINKRLVWISGTKSGGYTIHEYNFETGESSNATLNYPFSAGNEDIVNLIATQAGIVVYTSLGHWVLYDYDLETVVRNYQSTVKPVFIDETKSLYTLGDSGYDADVLCLVTKLGAITFDSWGDKGFFSHLYNGTRYTAGIGYIADDYESGRFLQQAGEYSELDVNVYQFGGDSFVANGVLNSTKSAYIIRDVVFQRNILYRLFERGIEYGVFGINKIDDDTGYGYTTWEGEIRGIFEDTRLDYPNNLFVQLISYYMAIQYKSKQNADAAGLVALYQSAEEQFYDSLGRDTYQYTRIQNVY